MSLVLSVAPARGASVMSAATAPARGAHECAERLDCTIADIDRLSMADRLLFLRQLQAGQVSRLVPGFDRWRALEGVLRFFEEESWGHPGDWVSIVDSSILEGVERGTAIALGLSTDTFGNPGAQPWGGYLDQLRQGQLTVRGVHDRTWSQAEQAATDHGVRLAAVAGVRPTSVEWGVFQFSQVYRWTLRNEPVVLQALALPGVDGQVRELRVPFLSWLTDVREDTPTHKGARMAYNVSRLDPISGSLSLVDLPLAYLPELFHEYLRSPQPAATWP